MAWPSRRASISPDAESEDYQAGAADLKTALETLDAYEAESGKTIDGHDTIYFDLAILTSRLDDPVAAIGYFDQAEASGYVTNRADVTKLRNPANSGRVLYTARAALKLERYDLRGALVDCDAALAMEKTGETYKLRAEIDFEMGDHFASSSDWRLGNDLDSKIDDWLFDAALLPLNKAVFNDPEHAAPLIARARQRVSSVLGNAVANLEDIFGRNYGESHREIGDGLGPALKVFDRAVAVEPDSAAAWFERGKVRVIYTATHPAMYDKTFNYDDIPGDFAHALELAPQDPAVWFVAGFATVTRVTQRFNGAFANFMDDATRTKLQSERQTAARQDFSRAIVLSPETSGMAHYQRALVELTSPQPDAFALETNLTAAIALNFSPSDLAWQEIFHPYADPALDTIRVRARLLRARVLLARGAANAALANLDQSLVINADDFNARFERGRLRVQRGDYDDAMTDLDLLIQGNPAVVQGRLWRAIAHDGQNEQLLARLDLEEATKRDPKLAARLKGTRYAAENPVDAVGIAPRPNRNDSTAPLPPGTALDHKNAGNELRGAGDLDGAVREYNLALQIDPTFADAVCNRGSVYNATGRNDLALADYAHAIDLDPHHRVAYLNRAVIWHTLGDTEHELADLDHAVDYADNDRIRADAHLRRANVHAGMIYLDPGHADLARSDALAAIKLGANDYEAWGMLGRIYLGDRDYPASIDAFRHGVAVSPELAASHAWLGIALAFAHDDEATAEVDAAIARATPEDLALLDRVLHQVARSDPESPLTTSLIAHVTRAREAH